MALRIFALARSRTLDSGLGCLGGLLGLLLGAVFLGGVSIALAASFAFLFDGRFAAAALCFGGLVAVIAGLTSLVKRSQAGPIARRRPRGPHVAVGADGVAIHSPPARYHPWARVRSVRRGPKSGMVSIGLDDGTTLAVAVSDAVGLEQALRAGLKRHREHEGSPRLRVLEPEGEMDEAWCERVRNVTADASYRVEGVSEDALLEVLEDPSQSATQRIGAALALARAPDEVRKRVRVAVAETADPNLGPALEHAAEGEIPAKILRQVAKT